MLTITILGEEIFNEETMEFSNIGNIALELEHSLASLSKWEQKWEIPFLGPQEKTNEQLLDYIRCMVLTPGVPENIVGHMSQANIDEIQAYIEAPSTATTFAKEAKGRGGREIITSELIYYWMASFQIPFEAENWHLNRLFSLLRIASIKNSKQGNKKMPKNEIAARNRELNRQRREQLNTTG